MTRCLLAGLIAMIAALPAAAVASSASAGVCDVPAPLAASPAGRTMSLRVAHPSVPAGEPEAGLRSALHRCVGPVAGGQGTRGRIHRV